MALAPRIREAGGGEGRERRGYGGTAAAGIGEGARVQRPERRSAGESDSQEPGALAADIFDRGGKATRERIGLGKHVHADQESGGVPDSYVRSGLADCDGEAVDCRDLGGEAFSGLE